MVVEGEPCTSPYLLSPSPGYASNLVKEDRKEDR